MWVNSRNPHKSGYNASTIFQNPAALSNFPTLFYQNKPKKGTTTEIKSTKAREVLLNTPIWSRDKEKQNQTREKHI